jgi:hypothetical protein
MSSLTISLPKSAIANPAYIYVYPNQGPSGIWVRVTVGVFIIIH